MDEARPTLMDAWEQLGADRDRWRNRARWWRALCQRARHDRDQLQTTFAGRVLIERDEARAQRDSLSRTLARFRDNHRALNELLHETRVERDRLRAIVDAMQDGPTIRRLVETLEASRDHAIAERNQLRAGLDTILDGLVGLDSDDAYVAITMEHMNVVRVMLRKEGT